jgi:hypothetical protein
LDGGGYTMSLQTIEPHQGAAMDIRQLFNWTKTRSWGRQLNQLQLTESLVSAMVCLGFFLCLTLITSVMAKSSQEFDPYHLVPRGAKVADVSPGTRETHFEGVTGRTIDAVFSDPWGTRPGIQQSVIFYTIDQTSVVSLYERSADSDGFVKRWGNRSLGVRFDPISGIWDINGDGEKEIVAFRWIGASVGGALDIFGWHGKAMKKISPDWNVDINRAQITDLNKNGRPEIILSHRFDMPSVYEWQRGAYREANEEFPWLFRKKRTSTLIWHLRRRNNTQP